MYFKRYCNIVTNLLLFEYLQYFLMCKTEDEICSLRNMFRKIKYIVFKIKALIFLLVSLNRK